MRKHWQTNYCLHINYCLHVFGLTNYTFLTKNLKRPNIYFQYAICKCSTRLELKKFNFKNAKFTKKQHSESQKHSESFGENCIQKIICSCFIFAPFDFIISGRILDWANINSTVSNYLCFWANSRWSETVWKCRRVKITQGKAYPVNSKFFKKEGEVIIHVYNFALL